MNQKVKIVVLDGYAMNPGDLSWDGLAGLGDLTVHDRTSAGQILARSAGAACILTNKTPLTRETLALLPDLKYIGVLATGYNIVDTVAARELGIVVANVPAYSTMSVAQLVFALLLEICHHVGAHNDAVKRGDWTNNPDFTFWNYPLIELDQKTFGIIGFGKIGRAVAGIAPTFGLKVLVSTAHPDPAFIGTLEYVSREELFARSDIISLHSPLNDKSKGMINAGTIAQMKDGVFLINTARGPLIVDQDLADALNSGKVGAAAMDVATIEPIQADNPLLKARNVIQTPHFAWAPKEARIRLMQITVTNLAAFVAGKPVNVVN